MTHIENAMRALKEAHWYLRRAADEDKDDFSSYEFDDLKDSIDHAEDAINSLDQAGDFE